MKRTLFIAAVMACSMVKANAATYTNLTESWCDETNNVIYNGQGYFAVLSATNSTSVNLTINMDSLVSYVNSNDYTGSSYMLLWENNVASYGLGDNADVSLDTGESTPYLSGWTTGAWNASTNRTTYDTLMSYADANGNVTLTITNSSTSGVVVSATNAQGASSDIYTASNLKYGAMNQVTGYRVNLNYVTSVTLNTASNLDTDTYVPPPDYSKPFESERTDGTSIGRVTFLGDSITHGVNDQSYRWQFFKILTDNGIENEISGPRSGYYNTPTHTDDAGSRYGGKEFANVHLAQASGRTHNIISGSTSYSVNGTSYTTGVNYGGNSTSSTAANYDSNTWFCMMGTNDILSDTPNSGPTTAQYATQMQKVLGGTVTYDATNDKYTWTASDNWGTMSTIVDDVYTDGDTFYMLSITPWGSHTNHNRDMDHYAGAEFNRNLEAWTKAYTASTGKNVVYVDVSRGMANPASSIRNMGHDDFFNSSSDRLHPNDQGSILMAGNLARAMGLGGRTAGLVRQSTRGWDAADIGAVTAGSSLLIAENAFTMADGYTIDFSASFGDGAANNWLSDINALSIMLGDGTNSGTLNLSESAIMWGTDVLFCWDNSTLADEGNLRIAWHNGNTADNALSGYYVWLDDMLIGQGLRATEGTGINGIMISASGANGTITGLTWADKAYAPTTQGATSPENSYYTTQNQAQSIGLAGNKFSGKDFSNATELALTSSTQIVTSTQSAKTVRLTSASGWTGMTSMANSGEVNVRLTGHVNNTIFGAMNNATGARLTLELVDGSSIGNGTYSGQTAAIAGSYGGGDADSFHVYLNGGTIGGDVVGGSINGNGSIGEVKLVQNGATVTGSIIGGSKVDGGVVDSASIIVTGGTISGNINAGGDKGTIGNTSVFISGGTISGNITKGAATRKEGSSSSVTVVGNSARIGGDITADNVTLRDVAVSGASDGFDTYTGTITASSLTLDNVQVDLMAELSASIQEIELINGSTTSAVLGDEFALARLTLADCSTFSALNSVGQQTVLSVSTLEAHAGVTLNADMVFDTSSMLILADTLHTNSEICLSSGMGLTLSEAMLTQLYGMQSVVLFDGVTNLALNGDALVDGETLKVNGVFANLDNAYNYGLSYVGSMVTLQVIPEPTTTAFSLAALAMLAGRRRRKN